MTERNGILKIYFLQLLITTVKNEQQNQLDANNLTAMLQNKPASFFSDL